jgi:membrane dipeptidase
MYTLVDRSGGEIALVKDAGDLDRCLSEGTFALILHFEGAEPIGRTLRELRTWYEAGLRSLGFVHARENIFGNGAPLAPTDPDGYVALRLPPPGPPQGPNTGIRQQTIRGWGLPRARYLPYKDTGLTQIGVELIKECEHLGIVVDVSHMTDQSFWDTMKVGTKPVIATHSSVRAICGQKRNLTDDQIRAIAGNGGTIGINFSMSFLRHDLESTADVTLDETVDHFDHIIRLVGDEHVSFGSDYDGGIRPPPEIGDCSQLGNLVAAFQRRGYPDGRIERIANGNFRRVLREVWKPSRAKEAAAVGR